MNESRWQIYVFEIIQVNPSERHREYNRSLRLRYYEETKACVTAVDAINGYFLHTMGQKVKNLFHTTNSGLYVY